MAAGSAAGDENVDILLAGKLAGRRCRKLTEPSLDRRWLVPRRHLDPTRIRVLLVLAANSEREGIINLVDPGNRLSKLALAPRLADLAINQCAHRWGP